MRKIKKKSKPVSKIYKKLPKGYKVVDPCRSAKQARWMRKAWPKDANAIIVKTGPSRGKKKHVFPYHIASNNRLYSQEDSFMKFGTILKLLLGTIILGLITFSIPSSGIIFLICLLMFIVLAACTGIIVFIEIDDLLSS